jgi:hypothetical protein
VIRNLNLNDDLDPPGHALVPPYGSDYVFARPQKRWGGADIEVASIQIRGDDAEPPGAHIHAGLQLRERQSRARVSNSSGSLQVLVEIGPAAVLKSDLKRQQSQPGDHHHDEEYEGVDASSRGNRRAQAGFALDHFHALILFQFIGVTDVSRDLRTDESREQEIETEMLTLMLDPIGVNNSPAGGTRWQRTRSRPPTTLTNRPSWAPVALVSQRMVTEVQPGDPSPAGMLSVTPAPPVSTTSDEARACRRSRQICSNADLASFSARTAAKVAICVSVLALSVPYTMPVTAIVITIEMSTSMEVKPLGLD